MIVGQKKLVSMIDNAQLDVWPSTIVLYGDFGCGKHLLLNYISEKFGLATLELTEILNQETIENIYQKPEPTIYYLDSNKLSVKQQNMILKFIEEPLKGSFIVILCENKSKLIDTVWNRCQILSFESYTKEELSSFIENHSGNDEYILSIATTPGQVRLLQSYDIVGMLDLANKMFDKMSTASFSNTLSISDKIAFKDEKDKIDIRVFIKVLTNCITNKIKAQDNNVYYKMFNLVNEFNYKSKLANVDMKYLFDTFLSKLWKVSRS